MNILISHIVRKSATRVKERLYSIILKLSLILMDKKHWITGIIGATVSVISFCLMILASSPPKLISLLQAIGVIGAFTSILAFTTGSTTAGIIKEHEETRGILKQQIKLSEEHSNLLKEIRDGMSRPKSHVVFT